MKVRVSIPLLLGSIACPALALHQGAQQPVVHTIAYEACHFAMTDIYGGSLTLSTGGGATANYHATINPKAHHPYETWIQFSCENPATAKTYLSGASIKLTDHGWVLDTSKEDPRFPSPRTTFYALHGKGWEGAGTTQDQTDGDEARRTRAFSFCIPHRQLALCGSIQSVGYLMWPKETTLPQVIKLLESIEFIDRPSPATTGTAAKP